mmetsp:Transcript_59017/g.116901  ORF Transcript_59017/g.116901 Transcript_59017/m.116901 type:complete len:91 (-) Transcript_59017:1143-1415(-)
MWLGTLPFHPCLLPSCPSLMELPQFCPALLLLLVGAESEEDGECPPKHIMCMAWPSLPSTLCTRGLPVPPTDRRDAVPEGTAVVPENDCR